MHGHKAADRPLPNALRSVAESMLGRLWAGVVGSALQDLLKRKDLWWPMACVSKGL